MLIPYLEADAALRDTFFRQLQVIVYSAASLPPAPAQNMARL